jgi:glycosyltransferase involved in cell wall biosynthesis
MPHIPESRIYYELLNQRCTELGIEDMIEFVPSPSEEVKFSLYRQCDSVIYTPPNEHFGIVPIEALEQRRPVIVINSGGPAETVIEGETGTKVNFKAFEKSKFNFFRMWITRYSLRYNSDSQNMWNSVGTSNDRPYESKRLGAPRLRRCI